MCTCTCTLFLYITGRQCTKNTSCFLWSSLHQTTSHVYMYMVLYITYVQCTCVYYVHVHACLVRMMSWVRVPVKLRRSCLRVCIVLCFFLSPYYVYHTCTCCTRMIHVCTCMYLYIFACTCTCIYMCVCVHMRLIIIDVHDVIPITCTSLQSCLTCMPTLNSSGSGELSLRIM